MLKTIFIISLFIYATGLSSLAQLNDPPLSNDTLGSVTNGFQSVQTQREIVDPTYNKRVYIIGGIHVSAYAGTLFILSKAWYKDFPKTSFHFFNDSREWLQVDKAGHAWTAYNIAKYSTGMWQWAGVPHDKALWYGGISSIGYQTILEYLDSRSQEWGWSWADMGANIVGVGLYVFQEKMWKEQKFQIKFSSFPQKHPGLENRADELFGDSFEERLLKDYNGQNYWLSLNLSSATGKKYFPNWLNIAIGYGAKGLYGGFENRALDKNGRILFDRSDISRDRQWYLSPDIDFTRIKTNKKGVKILFSLMNMLKMPAPALQFSNGKWSGHFICF